MAAILDQNAQNATIDLAHLIPMLEQLRAWIESRQYRGYDPYDLLNSPYFRASWIRKALPGLLLIQAGKRFGGSRLRHFLKVPPSRNPKTLSLCLSAYCDLARAGYDVSAEATWLKNELIRLRSPNEPEYCWGYDWDYLSLRGAQMPAFTPNAIATSFGGNALLEMAQAFEDPDALEIAASVARFLATRLNRSFESEEELCFSYTPHDKTRIYNSSALVGLYLARAGRLLQEPDRLEQDYLCLARKAMTFLLRGQMRTGGWHYGVLRRQRWIDSFHTSYNLCALLDYWRLTGESGFEEAVRLGDRYYRTNFFDEGGAPKYFDRETFPIDIHVCSQAILHFVAFSSIDAQSLARAWKTFHWTIGNMRAPDGSFYYQRHRLWTNRTPYMRWGQAWMFRALARLLLKSATPQLASDTIGE